VHYLDAAAFFYFYATGVTPAMEPKMVGKCSQHAREGFLVRHRV
jgi:hypothetical protein